MTLAMVVSIRARTGPMSTTAATLHFCDASIRNLLLNVTVLAGFVRPSCYRERQNEKASPAERLFSQALSKRLHICLLSCGKPELHHQGKGTAQRLSYVFIPTPVGSMYDGSLK